MSIVLVIPVENGDCMFKLVIPVENGDCMFKLVIPVENGDCMFNLDGVLSIVEDISEKKFEFIVFIV